MLLKIICDMIFENIVPCSDHWVQLICLIRSWLLGPCLTIACSLSASIPHIPSTQAPRAIHHLLQTLVLPKHEASNLNTLPRLPVILRRREGRVRSPSRAAILLRVEDLEQQCLIRPHVALVIPAVRRIRPDCPCLEAPSQGDDFECIRSWRWCVGGHAFEVGFIDCAGVADCERVAGYLVMDSAWVGVRSSSSSGLI